MKDTSTIFQSQLNKCKVKKLHNLYNKTMPYFELIAESYFLYNWTHLSTHELSYN